nr:hypothetical protein Iba_chr01bCG4470 [Ipomoea batatas]
MTRDYAGESSPLRHMRPLASLFGFPSSSTNNGAGAERHGEDVAGSRWTPAACEFRSPIFPTLCVATAAGTAAASPHVTAVDGGIGGVVRWRHRRAAMVDPDATAKLIRSGLGLIDGDNLLVEAASDEAEPRRCELTVLFLPSLFPVRRSKGEAEWLGGELWAV